MDVVAVAFPLIFGVVIGGLVVWIAKKSEIERLSITIFFIVPPSSLPFRGVSS